MAEQVGKEVDLNSLLLKCVENNISFASFSMPGNKELTTFVQVSKEPKQISINEEINSETSFIFAPFDEKSSEHKKYLLQPDYIFCSNKIDQEIFEEITHVSFASRQHENIPETTSKNNFINNAEQIIGLINSEKIDKAVLSRTQVLKFDYADNVCAELFADINNTYPNAFCFMANMPGTGIWMGASPEPLLFANKEKFHTVALAGTKYLNGVPVENVEWSVKEIHEQAVVSHYIEEKLNHLKANISSTKGPFNEKAAKLVHLKTEFSFNIPLGKNKLNNLLSALHPTPSVCGLPVEEARKLIKDLEKHERSYYSGYLGPVNFNQSSNIFVNLRCLQILNNHIVLYSGAGITGKSIPEKEWKETEQKLETLLSVIKNKFTI